MTHLYNTGLDRCEANFQPLTPLRFLERAASTLKWTPKSGQT